MLKAIVFSNLATHHISSLTTAKLKELNVEIVKVCHPDRGIPTTAGDADVVITFSSFMSSGQRQQAKAFSIKHKLRFIGLPNAMGQWHDYLALKAPTKEEDEDMSNIKSVSEEQWSAFLHDFKRCIEQHHSSERMVKVLGAYWPKHRPLRTYDALMSYMRRSRETNRFPSWFLNWWEAELRKDRRSAEEKEALGRLPKEEIPPSVKPPIPLIVPQPPPPPESGPTEEELSEGMVDLYEKEAALLRGERDDALARLAAHTTASKELTAELNKTRTELLTAKRSLETLSKLPPRTESPSLFADFEEVRDSIQHLVEKGVLNHVSAFKMLCDFKPKET